MTLASGTRLGSFEVTAVLGVGGMGEVYRARDTRLKRDVALKILPQSFAAEPERLARFQREAEVLAALNHPHIAQIYGLEQADGISALVLELVDGETLADRIRRGAIPLDEVCTRMVNASRWHLLSTSRPSNRTRSSSSSTSSTSCAASRRGQDSAGPPRRFRAAGEMPFDAGAEPRGSVDRPA